jgi:C1A family cysteine protease
LIIVTNVTYATELPTTYSLEKYITRIDDQGDTSWCTIYAVTNSIEAQMRSKGIRVPDGGFSKSWLHAKCKEIDNLPNTEGTTIYMALKIAMTQGLCPEYLCSTNNSPKLTEEMDIVASKYKIDDFDLISLDKVKQEIANGNFVIINSVVEKSNWMDRDDLILPSDLPIAFYHAVYLTGYDDLLERKGYIGFFNGVNSWGKYWGDNGTFNMAYDYFTKDNIKQAWIVKIKPQMNMRIFKYIRHLALNNYKKINQRSD